MVGESQKNNSTILTPVTGCSVYLTVTLTFRAVLINQSNQYIKSKSNKADEHQTNANTLTHRLEIKFVTVETAQSQRML